MKKNKQFTMRISQYELELLNELSKKTHRSKTDILIKGLYLFKEYVKEYQEAIK